MTMSWTLRYTDLAFLFAIAYNEHTEVYSVLPADPIRSMWTNEISAIRDGLNDLI